MKKTVLIMVALAGSLAAATTADVSGIWNAKAAAASARYGSVPMTAQITLLQDGANLKGTYRGGNGKVVPITAGSVSGTQVTFVVNSGRITANLSEIGSQLVGKMTTRDGRVANVVFTKR